MRESVPATSLSQYLHAVIHNFAEKSLSQTKTNMTFSHQRKVIFLCHQFQIIVAKLLYRITADVNRKIFGNSGDHLFLLGLVIDHWNLLFERV